MFRSIASVVVGFVVWSSLWVAGPLVVIAVAPEQFDDKNVTGNNVILAGFVIMSVVISIISGFITALIGKQSAMKLAWILGIVLLVVGIPIEIIGWDRAPAWYHLTFLALLVPGVLVGAALRRKT